MSIFDQIASSYSTTMFLLFSIGVFIGALVSGAVAEMFFARRHEKMMEDLQFNDFRQSAKIEGLQAEIDSLRKHVQSLKVIDPILLNVQSVESRHE